MSIASKLIADGKYNEACAEYNRIASKYGVDFKEVKKALAIEKTKLLAGKKTTVRCTPETVANEFQRVQKKVRSLDVNRRTTTENMLNNWYFANINIMLIEPSVFCTKLKEFENEHRLN